MINLSLYIVFLFNRSLNMLFLVILNFLGDNYKICVITEFDSDDCFASSQCVFLLPFLKACNFDF